ncbi:MAG: hypothetical protein SVZ03_00240 [Spirochaetota bacterium]|nr:hypothetical protein [Spirochaetota bacterium]
MYRNNSYERAGLRNRLKELSILFCFIITSALTSLMVMNLTIYPIAMFSIQHSVIYTYIINHLIWLIIIALLLYKFIKKLYMMKKYSAKLHHIIKDMLLKPMIFFATSLIILVLIITTVSIMYLLLQNNYYLLYRLTNI